MITLVLGGARSGKSVVAERLAARAGAAVTSVATAEVTDENMAARVEAHRARRPAPWVTIDAGEDLVAVLRGLEGTVLVDSLGTWVARLAGAAPDVEGLCEALVSRAGTTIVVSEEVGLGVHPSSEVGRHFRDLLGTVNQAVAAVSDEVLLVVAGRTLRLEAP